MAYNDCQVYPLVLYRLVLVVRVWAGRLFHVRVRVKVSTYVLIEACGTVPYSLGRPIDRTSTR